MPELPDVQVFKEYLDATSLHQRIEGVHVDESRVLKEVSPSTLREALRDRELESSRRHGKWLFVSIDGEQHPWLVLHFGMTGSLTYTEDPDDPPDHARLLLDFENGARLAYVNQRLFGEIRLTADPDEFVDGRDLGPDAMELDRDTFLARLKDRRGMIKSNLMNQEVVAGIGNEYSDEILFQARTHPKTQVHDRSEDELREIHEQTERVFEAAIEARCQPDDFPESFLNRERREGADCPAGCGGRIETIDVSGRSGYHCPGCQEA